MGIWWKRVKESEVPEGGIILKGDPKALSKKIPIIWRFQHKWQILEVESSSHYVVYFESNGYCMKKRTPIRTKKIAVRVGSDDVRFAAIKIYPILSDSNESLLIDKIFKPLNYCEIKSLCKLNLYITMI